MKELVPGAGSVTTHLLHQATPPVLRTSKQKQSGVERTDVLVSPPGPTGRSVARSVATELGLGPDSATAHLRRSGVLSARVSVSRLKSATSRSVLRGVSVCSFSWSLFGIQYDPLTPDYLKLYL